MRFSLGLVTSMPIRQSIVLSAIAEEADFHRVFVGEDILSREVFTYLSVLALRTRRVGIATGITSPYVRNLAVLASSALILQRVSDNRFDLGLGVGGLPEVQKLTGVAPRQSVDKLRETTVTIRRLLRGETVTCAASDRAIALQGFRFQKANVRISKILFGVRGPRLLSLAGEVADGVIFSGSKRHLPESLHLVEDAAARIGRLSEELERILWLPFIEGNDPEDLDLARIVVATVIGSLPQREVEAIPSLTRSEKVLRLIGAGDYRAAAPQIPEEVVRDFCFFGSVDDILDEARKFESLGFRELVIGPPFGRRPEELLKTIGR